MFKLLLTILTLLMLSGCTHSMPATDMRAAINECEDNNLTYEVQRDINEVVYAINCIPLDPPPISIQFNYK